MVDHNIISSRVIPDALSSSQTDLMQCSCVVALAASGRERPAGKFHQELSYSVRPSYVMELVFGLFGLFPCFALGDPLFGP